MPQNITDEYAKTIKDALFRVIDLLDGTLITPLYKKLDALYFTIDELEENIQTCFNSPQTLLKLAIFADYASECFARTLLSEQNHGLSLADHIFEILQCPLELRKSILSYLELSDTCHQSLLRDEPDLSDTDVSPEDQENFKQAVLKHQADATIKQYHIPKCTNAGGLTALQLAAYHGYLDVLQWAHQHTEMRDEPEPLFNNTLLMFAALSKDEATLEWLLDENISDPAITNSNDNSAAFVAAEHGCLWTLQTLSRKGLSLQQRKPNGNTLLHSAVEFNQANTAGWLIFNGLDPLALNYSDVDPISRAVQLGYIECLKTIFSAVSTLYPSSELPEPNSATTSDAIASPDTPTSPPTLTIIPSESSVSNDSLENVIPSTREVEGLAPPTQRIQQLLNQHHPDLFKTSISNNDATMLNFLLEKVEVHPKQTQLKLNNLWLYAATQHAPDCLAQLRVWGAHSKIIANNHLKRSALLIAVRHNQKANVEWLLANTKLTLQERDADRNTAAHLAAKFGHLELLIWLQTQHKIDLQVRNSDRYTPFLLACANGHAPVVNYLLEQGAKLYEQISSNETGLSLAAKNHHLQVTALLLEKGIPLTPVDFLKVLNWCCQTNFSIVQNLFRTADFGHLPNEWVYLDRDTLKETLRITLQVGGRPFTEPRAEARRLLRLHQRVELLQQRQQQLEGNTYSADSDDVVEKANFVFNTSLQPKFEKDFLKFGKTDEKRIKKIEESIRHLILMHILKDAQSSDDPNIKITHANFIQKNHKKLIKGDEKKLAKARNFFNSPVDVNHCAWRAFDANAPIKTGKSTWPNLFTAPNKKVAGIRSYTTSVSSEVQLDRAAASFEVRKRTAYLYLVVTDPKIPEELRKTLQQDFMGYIAEIRRVFSKNLEAKDAPCCYPGTIGRLGRIAEKHPLGKMPVSAESLIREVIANRVRLNFRNYIIFCQQYEDSYSRATQLYDALLMLQSRTAKDIAIDPSTAFVEDDRPGFTAELLRIREIFTRGIEGQLDDLIADIRQRFKQERIHMPDHRLLPLLHANIADLSGHNLSESLTACYLKYFPRPELEEQSDAQPANQPEITPEEKAFPLSHLERLEMIFHNANLPEANIQSRLQAYRNKHDCVKQLFPAWRAACSSLDVEQCIDSLTELVMGLASEEDHHAVLNNVQNEYEIDLSARAQLELITTIQQVKIQTFGQPQSEPLKASKPRLLPSLEDETDFESDDDSLAECLPDDDTLPRPPMLTAKIMHHASACSLQDSPPIQTVDSVKLEFSPLELKAVGSTNLTSCASSSGFSAENLHVPRHAAP